ncbi:copper chaperone PCu(A)C [Ornithinimicrobium panacihumi]|uniref:copper chaperone PCu(A)C n=1 Tax=Ornithinimicrobium panacihumi TaxID=2008449 RepID=UPI003F899FC7
MAPRPTERAAWWPHPSSSSDTVAESSHLASPDLVLVDGWAKAADGPMTGVFGTLRNQTDEDIHLVRVESAVAARTELHITVDDGAGGRLMQEAQDGFVVPAGGEHLLQPGGDHLMLMELTGGVRTGDQVPLVLVGDDDHRWTVTVTARAFSGAEEHYSPGDGDGATTTSLAP